MSTKHVILLPKAHRQPWNLFTAIRAGSTVFLSRQIGLDPATDADAGRIRGADPSGFRNLGAVCEARQAGRWPMW